MGGCDGVFSAPLEIIRLTGAQGLSPVVFMLRRSIGLFYLVFFSCAQDLAAPRISPPQDRLFFPSAQYVSSNQSRLLVFNTNFDRTFSAANVANLSVSELEMLATSSSVSEGAPALIEDFRPQLSAFAPSIPSYSGRPCVFVEGNKELLVVPHRATSELTVLELEGGELSCKSDGSSVVTPTDCDAGHLWRTHSEDAFSAACIVGSSWTGDRVLIGHLRAERNNGVLQTAMASVSKADIVSSANSGTATSSSAVGAVFLDNISGLVDLEYVPSLDVVLALGFSDVSPQFGVEVPLFLVGFRLNGDGESTVEELFRLNLRDVLSAREARDLLVYEDAGEVRLLISLRYERRLDSYSSGIAAFSMASADSVSFLGQIEIGEELTQLQILKGPNLNLIAAPDLRNNSVWWLTEKSGELKFASRQDGVFVRENGKNRIVTNLFSAPIDVRFLADGFASVANFENGTLSIVDTSGIDPSDFSVPLRIGRALLPNKKEELQ